MYTEEGNQSMKEHFLDIISEITFYERENLTFDLSLMDDLAISSVMLVELATMLEEAFFVSLENSIGEMLTCETVGRLYQYIKGLAERKITVRGEDNRRENCG